MTDYNDFKKNAWKWNKSFFLRGGVYVAQVPLFCCKMEKTSYERLNKVGMTVRNWQIAEFVRINSCMQLGDTRYINTTPCLKIVSIIKQFLFLNGYTVCTLMAVLTFSEIVILITLKERHTKCQLTIFPSL